MQVAPLDATAMPSLGPDTACINRSWLIHIVSRPIATEYKLNLDKEGRPHKKAGASFGSS
jgi:hypothetical protein